MDRESKESKESKDEKDEKESKEESLFQIKYNEFVEDALGALPEYTSEINAAQSLDPKTRLLRYQEIVPKSLNIQENPGCILPGVVVSEEVWKELSEATQKAIWEYVRILSMCCFMESGHNTPIWMEEAMKEMKKKFENVDISGLFEKFTTFFKNKDSSGFPSLPEKFLKGQIAKLAQEIVKEITPEDLGMTPDKMEECEKDPSRAFSMLFTTFSQNPELIKRTLGKIGKRLQQKIQSGSIRPQDIAAEAEELMKEFSENSSFVEMMEGLKSAFGMEDLGMARKAGREGSARLAMARERLRKKLERKKEQLNKK